MSQDFISDWLVRGILAAQAHENDEARTMLERALIELDVMAESYGQQNDKAREDAWYWLSTITDDPKEKRELLENVLASNPGYPEARRDLAIMEGRLKPEAIVNPDKAAVPVAPVAQPASSAVRRYVCPRCGGKLSFNVEKHALTCEYCGFRVAEEEAGLVAEHDFTASIYTASAHRWELPTQRILECKSCGAHVVLPPSQITSSCPFCGSALIVAATRHADLIEPGGIIPFQLDQQGAIQQVRGWLVAQRLNKDDLQRAAIARPRPIYYPFWAFNIGGEVRWRGTVETTGYNALERRPVVIIEKRDGSELAMDDQLLVPASHSLPNDLTTALALSGRNSLGNVSGYQLDALLPYSDSYLADWPTELYQISLADASLAAHERAYHAARERLHIDGEVRDLSYDSTGIIINSYRLVLLPVWLSQLRYKEQVYPLAVNGQTGAVHGRLPENALKNFLVGLLG